MKNILLLGATGSIGKSALKVIDQNRDNLNLIGISIKNNVEKCYKIIEDFSPKYVFIQDKSCFQKQKSSKDIIFLNNDDELNNLINHKDIDIIISAISGFSGLKTTFMAASSGKKILLANKESVVAGGDIILPIAKKIILKLFQ